VSGSPSRTQERDIGFPGGLFENRGFEDGHDCEDWLEAEKQVLIEVEAETGVRSGPLTTIRAA